MTEVALPTLPKYVKKPDDTAFKKELEALNERIEKLKKEQDAVKEKINKLPAKPDNSRRETIKTELAELREKQASLKQGRQNVYQQLDAINDSIKKKVSQVKSFQQKVPYKSISEVDDRIRELEQKIETGVRLVEEKKMLQEISLLKRSRTQVEGLDEQQAAIDRERNIHAEIKKNIDDSEAKKLSERYEQLDAEWKKLNETATQERETRNKLYDERNRIKGLLDEEFTQLRTLREENRKANDEYYTFLRQYREAKRELERQKKIQLEQEKRQEQLKQDLEIASLPAYEHEIGTCDNLIHFLQGVIGQEDKSNPNTASTNNTNNSAARKVDALPEGVVLVKKADEDYFVGGGKNKKGGKKQNNTNNNSTPKKENPNADALKLPLSTMEAFFEIKVTVPTKISEITSTLDKLRERKQFFVEESPKQTAINKKKAEEKFAAAVAKDKEEREAAEKERAEQLEKEKAEKEEKEKESKEEKESNDNVNEEN
ncbi:unnamed protein product [Cunninghamella blakesleeana]